jgi:hypothetical protein
MRKSVRTCLWIFVAPLILYVAYRVFIWLMIFVVVISGAVKGRAKKVAILYQTDHQKLLTACRELLDEGYYGRYEVRNSQEPNSPKFPKAILDLKPSYVRIYDSGYVQVEMWGGMSHFGVIAYREDFNKAHEDLRYGDKKLLDGLWYYDDAYENNPGYEKYIESLNPRKGL